MIELGYSKADLKKLKSPKQKKTAFVSTDNKANLTKEQANEEFKRQNFENAIDLYSKAILSTELSDDLAILNSNRSLCYLKLYTSSAKKIDQRNLMRALNDARMASELSPSWHKPFFG